jgi:hypothetical protein
MTQHNNNTIQHNITQCNTTQHNTIQLNTTQLNSGGHALEGGRQGTIPHPIIF